MKSKTLPFLFPAIGLILSGSAASAATLYYKSTTAANSWSGAFWGTAAGGPYTTNYTSGSDVVFEANGGTGLAITGATTAFASITANENVTVTALGTLATGGTVATINVASGKNLNFGSQAFSTAAGTGLTKNGAGILTLAGGSFTGGFTLNAGTVAVGGVNAMGAGGALTINGGTIASSSTAARDLTGKYTGGITIGGDFTLGDATNNGALTFTNNVALGATNRNITVNSAVSMGGVISGSTNVGFTKLGNGNLTLSGTNTYTGTATVSSGILTITNTGALAGFSTNGRYSIANGATLAVTNAVVDASITSMLGTTNFAAGALLGFDTTTAGRTYSVILADTTQGALGLNKTGTNTLTLTGANTYTGATTLTSGTLSFGTGALSTTSSLKFAGNSTLRWETGNTDSLATRTTTIGTGIVGTIDTNGNNVTFSALTGGGTLNKIGVGNLTLSGNNSGFTGAYGVPSSTNSYGDLIFGSANSIGSPTTWTLTANNPGGTGGTVFSIGTGNSATASGNWTISARTNNTPALRVTSGNITLSGNIAMQSGGSQYLLQPDSGASLRLSGTLSTPAGGTRTFTFGGAGTGYIDGVISNGSGTSPVFVLEKTGTGTWSSNNDHTYTGSNSLVNGTLSVATLANGGSNSPIGASTSGTGNLVFNGGGLKYTGGGSTTDRLFTINPRGGTIDSSGGGALIFSNTGSILTGNGGASPNPGPTFASGVTTISYLRNADLGVGMTITGAGIPAATTITAIDTELGTVTLSNATTAVNSGSYTVAGAVNRTLTLTGSNAGANEIAGNLSNASNLSTLGITKSGNGSWKLTGANTYTGATNITAGTLFVNGSLGNTALTVGSGATLGGSGTSTGSVATVSATSIIAPGNSPGTLTIGSLDVTNGGTFNFELGTSSDLLAITGALTGGGTLNFNFSDSGGLANTPYTLFTFASQSGLSYANLNALTLPGQTLDTTFGTGGWLINGTNLQVQFVPEPSTVLLGLLGTVGLLGRRRRKDAPAF